MKVERVSITREPDDKLADVRVSLGRKKGAGVYIVFRGDPAATVELLERATTVARVALRAGEYADTRGRPQG
jgi:hypothetical protein